MQLGQVTVFMSSSCAVIIRNTYLCPGGGLRHGPGAGDDLPRGGAGAGAVPRHEHQLPARRAHDRRLLLRVRELEAGDGAADRPQDIHLVSNVICYIVSYLCFKVYQ